MQFKIEIEEDKICPVIRLINATENTVAEVYGYGALLNKFAINTINVIDGFTSPENARKNITNGFKSAKLSPFVCRLANGRFKFNDRQFIISKFNIGTEAIHGLLYDAAFSIIDSNADDVSAFVKLQYNYSSKNEGFFFDYTCTVTYTLTQQNNLLTETIIKNNSAMDMPVADGWHPYFNLGCKVDELSFKLNSNKILEFNERLLPTGKFMDYTRFQQGESIGNTTFDNCFLLNKNNQPACILRNPETGLTLTINAGNTYPYLQVYTPAHRGSIAIENLSSAPDAFNNNIGLITLKAGETISFTTNFNVQAQS